MSDLSFLQDDSTLGKVDRYIEVANGKRPRRYLGMSSIGDGCTRRLWLKYHGGFRERLTARQIRLFDMGKIIERRIIRQLRGAGYNVHSCQTAYEDLGGRFKGHPDGIIEGMEESTAHHILEIKSANEKNFKKFQENGIGHYPKYVAQVQCLMHYAKLDRAFFVVENKNNSAQYQERVHFDRAAFELLREKARLIIESDAPPLGINDNPMWWECKMCPLNNEEWCRR